MKLDKRIIKGKRPLTCFDIEEAEQYIGELCYICDEYDQFHALKSIKPTILKGVEDCEVPFQYDKDFQAEFCLPCEWVTEEEKKYRPYTIEEFTDIFTVGQPIKFRKKGEKKDDWFSVLIGYWNHQVGDEVITYILIGPVQYTLDELFEDYEWQASVTEEFKPFGVAL